MRFSTRELLTALGITSAYLRRMRFGTRELLIAIGISSAYLAAYSWLIRRYDLSFVVVFISVAYGALFFAQDCRKTPEEVAFTDWLHRSRWRWEWSH